MTASWVSGFVTELCRNRLEFLEPNVTETLHNLTACEQSRADLVGARPSKSALSLARFD